MILCVKWALTVIDCMKKAIIVTEVYIVILKDEKNLKEAALDFAKLIFSYFILQQQKYSECIQIN